MRERTTLLEGLVPTSCRLGVMDLHLGSTTRLAGGTTALVPNTHLHGRGGKAPSCRGAKFPTNPPAHCKGWVDFFWGGRATAAHRSWGSNAAQKATAVSVA